MPFVLELKCCFASSLCVVLFAVSMYMTGKSCYKDKKKILQDITVYNSL